MNGLGAFSLMGVTAPDVLWVGVQASALVLVAAGAARGLRRLPAAGRHAVWSVALVGVLICPPSRGLHPFRCRSSCR